MKIQLDNQTLRIREIEELSAANAHEFRERVRGALGGALKTVEIDLGCTDFIDSCGLGALIAIYKSARNGEGGVTMRLLNPRPPVQQLLELTRMHRLFEICKE